MHSVMDEVKKIIEGPAGALELRLYESKKQSRGILVMCHPHPLYQGNMDNKVVTIAVKAFAELGFDTVRFNYRGVGQSEGEYGKGVGEAEDLLAVVDWLKKYYAEKSIEIDHSLEAGSDFNFGPLYLGGFSFGCYVAYRGAGLLNPEGLLLVAPAVAHLNFEELPVPTMPTLVIQGDADEVVSAEATYQFVDRLGHPFQLEKLPSVGHFFHGQLLTLKTLIKNYYGQA